MPGLRVNLYILIILLLCGTVYGAEKIFVNEEINSRLNIYKGPIISFSDSLFLNHKKLYKDSDYKIDYQNGIITLINYKSQINDTLKIYYTPLPSWLKKRYGIQTDPSKAVSKPRSISFLPQESILNPPVSSKINISGAKKFSVISETTSSSRFDQSLELTISGELSPGLFISGAVSDREYYSSAGSINSALSELDKINLSIKSKHFKTEIGDLELNQKSDYGPADKKQVSGFEVAYQNKKVAMLATVARPRGRRETIKFYGQDLIQGPYRIFTGSSINSIIPGSEKVWLNGSLLKKGADKDYSINYSLATITFSPKVPVDSRSRIEVDFEPLDNDFQKEYYRFQAGTASADSIIQFEFGYLHEGDNKNKLKSGQLSPDDKLLLENIGGDNESAWTDGAVPDSVGDYIASYDYTNYRYYVYVGDSLGDFSVRFSSVGENKGEYKYIGSGVYQYVGVGLGDYLPRVAIPIPTSENYFNAGLHFKPVQNGFVSLKIRQSQFDRNLFSTIDDNNSTGGMYLLSAQYGATPNIRSKMFGWSVMADYTEENYKYFARQNSPDLLRKFLIPDSLSSAQDKIEITTTSAIVLPSLYSILLSGSMLDYKNKFTSAYGEITAYPNYDNSIWPVLTYQRLRADFDTSGISLKGQGDIYGADWKYLLNNMTEIRANYKHNRRTNHYSSEKHGTTENQYNIALKYKKAGIKYEQYNEDTLITSWQDKIKRDRVVVSYGGKITGVKTDIYLTAQKLKQNRVTQNQLMARMNYSFAPSGQTFSASGSYSLSDESRFERGLRYLEVEPGFGKFIFEDSQYIPDSNGNYIEVEEILSNQAEVKKGERSFNLYYNPNNLYVRLGSNITEELLSGGGRTAIWLVPFISDGTKKYLYRKLYYSGDIKLFRQSGFYLINLSRSYNYESRLVGGADFEKYEQTVKATLRNKIGHWHFSQEGTYFKYKRDSYYLSAGNIDGFKIKTGFIKHIKSSQINGEISFRSARDDNGAESKQYSIKIAPALRFANQGETVISIMAYFQELIEAGSYSYRLTENLSGKKGGLWSIRSEYRVGRDIKFVISMGGRFSDERKPRVTGRGELIAKF